MNTKSELKEEVGEDNRDFIVHVEWYNSDSSSTTVHECKSENVATTSKRMVVDFELFSCMDLPIVTDLVEDAAADFAPLPVNMPRALAAYRDSGTLDSSPSARLLPGLKFTSYSDDLSEIERLPVHMSLAVPQEKIRDQAKATEEETTLPQEAIEIFAQIDKTYQRCSQMIKDQLHKLSVESKMRVARRL